MKLASFSVALAATVPGVLAWGSLGHITTAYIASQLVAPSTTTFLQDLLRNHTDDYLGGIATWADTVRYTKWGRFTGPFHFIDAKDSPPDYCGVDLARDCKAEGCVVTALANYTAQAVEPRLPWLERSQALKFVVHFVGDLHQPLHNEDVARGGNGIKVKWRGVDLNLHHVWDSSIAELWIGGLRGKPYVLARDWAARLVPEIETGKFAAVSEGWLAELDFTDPVGTALAWAREGNQYVCSHVLPEGPKAIVGQELSGAYYKKAGPLVELQVARGGYRLAAWLDKLAEAHERAAFEMATGEL